MYDRCIWLLTLLIKIVGLGWGSVVDIMEVVRYCSSLGGS